MPQSPLDKLDDLEHRSQAKGKQTAQPRGTSPLDRLDDIEAKTASPMTSREPSSLESAFKIPTREETSRFLTTPPVPGLEPKRIFADKQAQAEAEKRISYAREQPRWMQAVGAGGYGATASVKQLERGVTSLIPEALLSAVGVDKKKYLEELQQDISSSRQMQELFRPEGAGVGLGLVEAIPEAGYGAMEAMAVGRLGVKDPRAALALLGFVKNADKGVYEAAKEGAKGAVAGQILKTLGVRSLPTRAAGNFAFGYGQAKVAGASDEQAIVAGATQAGMGLPGPVRGPAGRAKATAKEAFFGAEAPAKAPERALRADRAINRGLKPPPGAPEVPDVVRLEQRKQALAEAEARKKVVPPVSTKYPEGGESGTGLTVPETPKPQPIKWTAEMQPRLKELAAKVANRKASPEEVAEYERLVEARNTARAERSGLKPIPGTEEAGSETKPAETETKASKPVTQEATGEPIPTTTGESTGVEKPAVAPAKLPPVPGSEEVTVPGHETSMPPPTPVYPTKAQLEQAGGDIGNLVGTHPQVTANFNDAMRFFDEMKIPAGEKTFAPAEMVKLKSVVKDAAQMAKDAGNEKTWSERVISKYGEQIRPYLQELWQAVQAFIKGESGQEKFMEALTRISQRVRDANLDWKKIGRNAVDLLNAPRTLKTAFDLSAYRQGAILSLPPSQWGKMREATAQMLRSMNPAEHASFVEDLHSGLPARKAQEAGLYLATRPTGKTLPLTAREENFTSQLIGKVPVIGKGVQWSERTYTAYLDKLRMETFKDFLRANPLASEKELSDYAKFINKATGRGDLGKFEQIAPIINSAFFAPRNLVAHFQAFNPATLARMAPAARKAAFSALFQYTGMVAGALTMAKLAGADVGTDPNSPDFLKIKVGNTRYDILSGRQQILRLGWGLMKGFARNASGEGNPRGKNPDEVTAHFLRGKLSPLGGDVADVATGKTFTGQPLKDYLKQPADVAVDQLAPFVFQDAYEAWKDAQQHGQSPAAAALKTLPGVVGAGVQTYDAQKPAGR